MTISQAEAKKLIQKLLVTRKSGLDTDYFGELLSLVQDAQNREILLLADIHIALAEYFHTHRNEETLLTVAKVTSMLAENTQYNYCLAVNGKLLEFIIKWFDLRIDRDIPSQVYEQLSESEKNTPSELDLYYSIVTGFKTEVAGELSNLFKLLMKNNNSARWLGKNKIDEIGPLLITIMLVGEQNEDNIKDDILEGLGYLFKHKESVEAINRSTYISTWIFRNMLNICCKKYESFIQYINWIGSLLEFEEAASSSTSNNDHSLYLTRILNSIMGDLSYWRVLGKQSYLLFAGQIDNKKREKMFLLIAKVFEIASKNEKFLQNLVSFRMTNGFDTYFRFLVELSIIEEPYAFCTMGTALLRMLSSCKYILPNCYRKLSLLLLEKEAKNPEFFVSVIICRINKFFFYDAGHRRLFTDIVESVLILKKPEFEYEMRTRMQEVDEYLIKKLSKLGFLIKPDNKVFERKSHPKPNATRVSSNHQTIGIGGMNANPITQVSNNYPRQDVNQNTQSKSDSDQGSEEYSSEEEPGEGSELVDSNSDNSSDQSAGNGSGEDSSPYTESETDSEDVGDDTSKEISSLNPPLEPLNRSPIIPTPVQKQQSSRHTIKTIEDKFTPASSFQTSISSSLTSPSFISYVPRRIREYKDTDFISEIERPLYIPSSSEGGSSASLVTFMFSKILAQPSILQKNAVYPFLAQNNKSRYFQFFKDCRVNCKFCVLFDGFYNMEIDELYSVLAAKIEFDDLKPHNYFNHFGFALVQLYFDLFSVCDRAEFFENTLNSVFRILVSKRVDTRIKCSFFLYLEHLLDEEKSIFGVLLGTEFSRFLMDYLAEFMVNFKLLSFKQAMSNKFEGNYAVFVESEDQISAPRMMRINDGRSNTIVKLDRQNSNEHADRIINFSKKVIYKDCIWDDVQKRFRYMSILLTPENWKRMKEYQSDMQYEKGIYTFYFWRLHCIYHLLDILLMILKSVKGNSKKTFFGNIGHLPLQIIEISVLFKDYGTNFVPQKPFLVDSECWTHTTKLLYESNVTLLITIQGKLQEILKQMITRDNKLLSKTVRICSRSTKYLGGFLDLLNAFGTLEQTVTYLENLMVISTRMLERDPESIAAEPKTIDMFVVTLRDKISSVAESSQAILKENKNGKGKELFNERGFAAILKFGIYCLQAINLLGIEKLVDINDEEGTKRLISSLFTFNQELFRTTTKVHKRYNKNRKIKKYTNDYSSLSKQYYKVLSLFFWWASDIAPEECGIVISSPLFSEYIDLLPQLSLEPRNLFSIYCILTNAAKHFGEATQIEMRFKKFSEFVRDQIKRYRDHRPKIEMIYPLVRLLAMILKKEPHEAFRFIELKDTLSDMLEEISDLMNRGEDAYVEGAGNFGDLSIIDEEGQHFVELSRSWLLESNQEISFLAQPGEHKGPNNPKVEIERALVLGALEKATLYVLSVLRERRKMREDLKDKFKPLNANNTPNKGPMSLETIAGLKQREDIQLQAALAIQDEDRKFKDKFNLPTAFDSKTPKQEDSLKDLTLFSSLPNTDMYMSKLGGRPLNYFKANPFPHIDLDRERDNRNRDPRGDISYFTMRGNSNSDTGVQFQSEKGVSGNKSRFREPRATLKSSASNLLYSSNNHNLLNKQQQQEIISRAMRQEDLVLKMAEEFKKKDHGNMIKRVDMAYENLFANRPKFNF